MDKIINHKIVTTFHSCSESLPFALGDPLFLVPLTLLTLYLFVFNLDRTSFYSSSKLGSYC